MSDVRLPSPEIIRSRGRSLETCFDQILAPPEQSDQKIKSLCSSVRRFRDATIKAECKSDYPHALSGFVESLGSGGGPGSEAKTMTPEIKTEIPSLLLRRLREEDAKELYLRVDQNREHLRWRASWVDGTTTKSDTLKFVRFCLESAVSGTGFHYALLLDSEIVGLVAFNRIEKINRSATMGYWLAKSQTGRGQ